MSNKAEPIFDRHRSPRWRYVPAYLLLAISAGGCFAIGAVLDKTFGPPPVPAKFEPPKVATLVFVENYGSPNAGELDSTQVARSIGDHLKQNDAVPVVDPDQVQLMRDADSAKFHTMTIPAVGAATGAKQVLYVNVVSSEVAQDSTGSTAHATALARVKVVDVATGNTLWPVGVSDGYEIAADVPYGHEDEQTMTQMHVKLLQDLSGSIARLFYSWKPDSEHEFDTGSQE